MGEINFTVEMKTRYMFNFLFYNSYAGVRGVINMAISAIGVLALVFGFGNSLYARVALIILACLFTVIEPLMLLFKAFMQVKTSTAFKLPITYTFKEEGVVLSQGEQVQEAEWDILLLARETRVSLILFTGNNNAIILPKKCIGDQLEGLKALLRKVKPAETTKLHK